MRKEIYSNSWNQMRDAYDVEIVDLKWYLKCGASCEGFIVREVIRCCDAKRNEIFYSGVNTGAELDLLIINGQRRLGFEVKLTRSPKVTASMRSTFELLNRDQLVCGFFQRGQALATVGWDYPLSGNCGMAAGMIP